MNTLRIAIIGNGAVAEGLVREFGNHERSEALAAADASTGVGLVQQWTRTTHTPRELVAADLYVLAVSDGAVAEVSRTLPFAPGSVVAHTAGCVAMTDMAAGAIHRAVLYPLQSFTRGRPIAGFRNTPFFIEGETPHALRTVRAAAEAISDNVREMPSERRARIHLAGAFANNFSNAMLSLAESIAADVGESFDVLRPIVAETFSKALAMSSPRLAQTGAAQRGDHTIQAGHLAILENSRPDLVGLYKEISNIITERRSRDKVLPSQGRT